LATFALALQSKTQADASTRLAETAERQLELAAAPVVRVMREGAPNQADIKTVNEGHPTEVLVVRLENRGQGPAEIEAVTMIPGGDGTLAGMEERPGPPILEPNGEWDVDFHPTPGEKERNAAGGVVRIRVFYLAIAAGMRYQTETVVHRDLDASDERWLIVREYAPVQLGARRGATP
jgi:hypothetical protein